MDLSIQEVAALTGTTSRTLRHYDAIGLLPPTRIAGNGYRHYDHAALVRLQRILLLRELGLGLPAIAEVLTQQITPALALQNHVGWLQAEQERLGRQLAAVERTIETISKGEETMTENMFDGFDHTQYKEEVENRWGKEAYAEGDAYWRGKDSAGKSLWKENVATLNGAWIAACASGAAPDSAAAQGLARRHVQWLASIPGTPAAKPDGDVRGYVLGLAEMYVADARFAASYGGAKGAGFVRDALAIHVEREL